MKKAFLFAALATTLSAQAATVTVTDHLERRLNADGFAVNQTVNFYRFTAQGGEASFNVLASGVLPNGLGDSMIWLFRDDGQVDGSDLIASNDDSWGFGPESDGSTSGLDSYLSLVLNAGQYLLAVGNCCESGSTILDGLQFGNEAPFASVQNLNYRLTFSGDLTLQSNAVPVPTTLALAGLGLFALGASRRRAA